MRRAGSLLIMAALVSFSGALWAQETGSRIRSAPRAEIPTSTKMSPTDKGRVMMAGFAECLVDRTPGRARAYLNMFPGTEVAAKTISVFVTPECIEPNAARLAGLRMDETLLRGGLYAALYKKDFKHKEPSINTTPINYWDDAKGQNPEVATQYVALRQFADCIVRKHGADSRALILADVAGEKERAVMAAMIPDLHSCMVEGLKVEFSKSVLVGLIAEALYRTSLPPVNASGATR